MKKFVKVFSWLLIFGALGIALLERLIAPGIASGDLNDAPTQFVITVFGMMLLGLFGLAMTDEGGGSSGPPRFWG